MALNIDTLRKAAEGAMYVSPVRLGLTADGELCEDTDVKCVKLLVGAGGSIPAVEAAKYGLIADASAVTVLSEAAATLASEEPAAEDERPDDSEPGEQLGGDLPAIEEEPKKKGRK